MLTKEQVEHVAHLSHLRLTDEEKEKYRQQLSAILEYARRLQELDTTGIPPTSSVLPERAALREDVSRPGLSIDQLLMSAPAKEARQFIVPPILE